MKNYRMIVDCEQCIGCHACEVACKQEFNAPLGFFRIMTLYLDTGTFPKVKRDFLPISCSQCEDSACLKACSKNAIFQENGIVSIDKSKCNGCGECVKACSIGAIYVNPLSDIAEKCNLCSHRLEIGLRPACEATCVANAIKIIDINQEKRPENAKVFKTDLSNKLRTLYVGANEIMKEKFKSSQSFSPLNYEIYNWARRDYE